MSFPHLYAMPLLNLCLVDLFHWDMVGSLYSLAWVRIDACRMGVFSAYEWFTNTAAKARGVHGGLFSPIRLRAGRPALFALPSGPTMCYLGGQVRLTEHVDIERGHLCRGTRNSSVGRNWTAT